MTVSKLPDAQTSYLDFAQFNQLKKANRTDSEAGMRATARQLEGVFLNMMLKSMRQANQMFGEDNYLSGKDAEYFRDMYDQQISQSLSAGRGIGLAEMVVRQMQRLESAKAPEHVAESLPVNPNKQFDIAYYRERAVPVLLRQDISELDGLRLEQAVEEKTLEAEIFAPTSPASEERQPAARAWQTPAEFVDAILPHAQRAGRKLNVDPMAIVAQAVLETGWGNHVMRDADGQHSFNLFGIKASASWDGDTVKKKTLEYRNGIAAQEYAAFRSYASLESAFDDYVRFLQQNPRYQNALNANSEAKQWGFSLQKAGYATDPNYGNKIASLLESDILQAKAKASVTTL